ncbi:hypothetical protein HanHA300_Chr13g0465241 [Helianthus annuus]|nr:hypothetical protein HanHA300_Chr13g0465241 [Helianthus annuus]KAJ0479306.1 hypothetical protein HanIR_Chr13g0618531 [Helianthus annuus]KAJ0662296.1 hypothetical protein HanLR1_Chr13g0467851 [Helianthus annuus]KAJ0669825.1 hypothetical protein HanOQP8_Chr13g0466981 [Helianthus annuus]
MLLPLPRKLRALTVPNQPRLLLLVLLINLTRILRHSRRLIRPPILNRRIHITTLILPLQHRHRLRLSLHLLFHNRISRLRRRTIHRIIHRTFRSIRTAISRSLRRNRILFSRFRQQIV